jgi:ABC-type nitrate/sulfonate/bicarbonate transport system ATPase subunit
VRYLIAHEFARTAEDIVWRRSKLGLRLSTHEVKALDDWIATHLERGSLNVLLGPTLSGKTSLMRLMAGLDKPTSGSRLVRRQGCDRRCACRIARSPWSTSSSSTIRR